MRRLIRSASKVCSIAATSRQKPGSRLWTLDVGPAWLQGQKPRAQSQKPNSWQLKNDTTTSTDSDGLAERRAGDAGCCRRAERAWHLGRNDGGLGPSIAA